MLTIGMINYELLKVCPDEPDTSVKKIQDPDIE
jgi:hypothetical protein